MHDVAILIVGECVLVGAWVWRATVPGADDAKRWWQHWPHRATRKVDDRGIGTRAETILAELDATDASVGGDEDIIRLVRCHQWEPLTPAMRALREAAARRSGTT